MTKISPQELASIMIKHDISLSAALIKLIPDLADTVGCKISQRQSENDIILIQYFAENNTPSNDLLNEARIQLNISAQVIRKIIMGSSLYSAKNSANRLIARQGDLKGRVLKINSYIENEIQPLAPFAFAPHVASTLNSKLALHDHSADDRVKCFLHDHKLTINQFAWILYDITNTKLNHLNGISIFTRSVLTKTYGLKIKVDVSETSTEICKASISEKGDIISITVRQGMSPLEYYKCGIFDKISYVLNDYYVSNGYEGGVSEYIESLKTKLQTDKNRRKFRKIVFTNGYFHGLKSFHPPEHISTLLDLANRYAKSNETPFSQKLKIYSKKNRVLTEAYHANEATITKLIRRPNPFMVDDNNLVSLDEIVTFLEKIRINKDNEFSNYPKLNEFFNSLNNTPSTQRDVYVCNVINLMKHISNEQKLSESIWTLLDQSSLALKFIRGFKFDHKTNYSNHFLSKMFASDYTHVWEFQFYENIFHIPMTKFTPNNAKLIDVIDLDWQLIRGSDISDSEMSKFPLEVVLGELFIH